MYMYTMVIIIVISLSLSLSLSSFLTQIPPPPHNYLCLLTEIESALERLSTLLTVHTPKFNVLVTPLRAAILEVLVLYTLFSIFLCVYQPQCYCLISLFRLLLFSSPPLSLPPGNCCTCREEAQRCEVRQYSV